LPYCLEAVRLQPRLPAAHNNLGNAYRALERWPEAHAAYDAASDLAPDLARIHANRGLALFMEGRRADAFPCFRRAVELAPDDAEMWRYLADAYGTDDNAPAALPCWERIVALEPEKATAHSGLGRALQEEGWLAEAAACYRWATRLEPDHAETLLNQGGLHEELGDLASAEACYRRLRSIDATALLPLARLATLLRGRLPDPDREAIRVGLNDPRTCGNSSGRGPLLFGLAQVLDAQGDYDGAAACLVDSNALALEQNRKQGKHYAPEDHAAFVDQLIECFSADLFGRLAGGGLDTRQPVFVFGMPRSGTTLVEQILASHSRVHGAGELRLARHSFESIPTLLHREDDMRTCLGVLDPTTVWHASRRYREGLEAHLQRDCPGKVPERIVEKMPDNYLYLGLLALLFPKATLIHVRRDLRDVALSCWMTNFRGIRWANDVAHLAARCRDYWRLMAHWQAVVPVPIHEVVYERLVDDFETEARRLVATCGLEWEPACSNFHQTTRPVRTASLVQVRQPLYRRSLARWKHYDRSLAGLFARLPGN
jgi:tetratricopeptide (TPR) repeat protein